MIEMCTQRATKEGIQDWSTENLPKDFPLNLSVSLIANRFRCGEHNKTHAKWSAERNSFIPKDSRLSDPDRELYKQTKPPATQRPQPQTLRKERRAQLTRT